MTTSGRTIAAAACLAVLGCTGQFDGIDPATGIIIGSHPPDGGTLPDGGTRPDGGGNLPPESCTAAPANPTLTPLPSPLPSGSSFTPPPVNHCRSAYDRFYAMEPGVYVLWPLCETGSNPDLLDAVGEFDLSSAAGSWNSGSNTFNGGAAGPVSDGETAVKVTTSSSFVASQDIPLNTQAGTMAVWINASASTDANAMINLAAILGNSGLTLATQQPSGTQQCFFASFINSSSQTFTATHCGYAAGSWHRVVMTWTGGVLTLFVDGASAATASYSGALDTRIFLWHLFPENGNDGQQMSLAKVLIANQVWSSAQVAADFNPTFTIPPTGGTLVTTQKLGTVHKDVLGYDDYNSDLSTPALVNALTSGLSKAGVKSLRYADGTAGIGADNWNWQGGLNCGTSKGQTASQDNGPTQDNTAHYLSAVAQPLGLDLGYTVNYGTNPPTCNAGGDPNVNGAQLVQSLNVTNRYGFKYFEIGNEVYGGGNSETDFHPDPADGASYASYEVAFYNDMKAVDSSIQIGIPVADGIYSWDNLWTEPALAAAKYDAVIFHNYPIVEPVTDGNTLYPDRLASNLARTRSAFLNLQTELLNVGKDPQAIWVTEWNGSNGNGSTAWSRQTMGVAESIFGVIELAEYMRAGVQWATYLGQFSQDNACYQYNYDSDGETSYAWVDGCGGNFLVYTGPVGGGEQLVGFKAGDITPMARAYQLLSMSGFATEGEQMLETVDDQDSSPWLLTYAATHQGSYAVILINRDRDTAHDVPVQLQGLTQGGCVHQWTYGREQYDQSYFGNWAVDPFYDVHTAAWNGTFTATLPPWSATVLVF